MLSFLVAEITDVVFPGCRNYRCCLSWLKKLQMSFLVAEITDNYCFPGSRNYRCNHVVFYFIHLCYNALFIIILYSLSTPASSSFQSFIFPLVIWCSKPYMYLSRFFHYFYGCLSCFPLSMVSLRFFSKTSSPLLLFPSVSA